jgi:hypothetical protein
MSSKKRLVSVYILPPGSKPIVRVQCPEPTIAAERLFKLCCDTIGLYEKSRKLFGLFRGMLHPVKKYASEERIALPVQSYPISIQKWSFDVALEVRLIRTDPIAIRLLALQYNSDLEMSKKNPNQDELQQLKLFEDPDFQCYKQYLDCARTIHDYDWTTVQNIEVVRKVKLVSNTLQKGSKVDLVCTPKKMIIVAGKVNISLT